MSPITLDVPAVLARHGIAPDADAATLLAALAARGWEARVEERPVPAEGGTRRGPRFQALVIQTRPPEEIATLAVQRCLHRHRQAGGRTAEQALGRVLAAVLAAEG